jgi:hypothetical protein
MQDFGLFGVQTYAKYILFTPELHVINLIQPYMITFVIYLWQVGGFPLVSHVINLIHPYMITSLQGMMNKLNLSKPNLLGINFCIRNIQMFSLYKLN